MRKQHFMAMSMPDYIRARFSGNAQAHTMAIVCVVLYDCTALMLNTSVGAFLLFLLADIPVPIGMAVTLGVCVSYSAWRGLNASVVTDVIQYLAILVIAFVVTPWAISLAGGLSAVSAGLGGVSGEYRSVFNFEVFYSFGIVTTIVLITGPLADQMFYQRAMAMPEGHLMPMFTRAAILFAVVPVILGFLGFIAATGAAKGISTAEGFPPILVGVAAVKAYLPEWALIGFVVMAICALSSTIDSALCGIGSIWTKDIYGTYINPGADDVTNVRVARLAVFVVGVAAIITAILIRNYMNASLMFNMSGIVASAVVPAMVLAVFWERTTAFAVASGAFFALLIGGPYGWWANYHMHVQGDDSANTHVILAAVITLLISLLVTWIVSSIPMRRTVPATIAR
jgi:Na+/proline symporter